MKISKKEVNILIGLLGIVIAFCAYQFGFLNLQERTQALETENRSMESDIRLYESWVAQQDQFEADTEQMQAEIIERVGVFPADYLPEDAIKLAYQLDNRNTSGDYVFINSLSFSEPTVVYTTDYSQTTEEAATEDAASAESIYPVYTLYESNVGMGIQCSYSGIKSMVTRVYNIEDRKSIEAVTLAYDQSTGLLSGSMTMNMYSLYGTDKQYRQPDLTPVRQGTENPFGTITMTEDAADSEETENTEESE